MGDNLVAIQIETAVCRNGWIPPPNASCLEINGQKIDLARVDRRHFAVRTWRHRGLCPHGAQPAFADRAVELGIPDWSPRADVVGKKVPIMVMRDGHVADDRKRGVHSPSERRAPVDHTLANVDCAEIPATFPCLFQGEENPSDGMCAQE
jgi:hypothetical protein